MSQPSKSSIDQRIAALTDDQLADAIDAATEWLMDANEQRDMTLWAAAEPVHAALAGERLRRTDSYPQSAVLLFNRVFAACD